MWLNSDQIWHKMVAFPESHSYKVVHLLNQEHFVFNSSLETIK